MPHAPKITLTGSKFWWGIDPPAHCCGNGAGFLRGLTAVPTGDTWGQVVEIPIRKQQLKDKLVEHKQYIALHDQDLPEIRSWKWGTTNSGKPA